MINTLIIDDSALARDIIRDFLEAEGSFNIIGEASDGEEGIEKILSLNPDLVTLDLEMPKKNGLEVIESVMKQTSIPIVVVTNHDSAKTAYEATVKGALEFYSKDVFTAFLETEKRREIYETLKRISSIKTKEHSSYALESPVDNNCLIHKRKIRAIVIASSTGGPKALSFFFSKLPENFSVPIVIVQHNSTGFDKGFAQWLDAYTKLNIKLAEEREALMPGAVYIAKTDKHLELCREGDKIFFQYNNNEPENNQKPSADVLFRSAAKCLKDSLISIVMTGMGSDGALGTKSIKEMGGITLAQDKESSLIFGMPKAAAETGCVDMVLPLDRIAAELLRLVK